MVATQEAGEKTDNGYIVSVSCSSPKFEPLPEHHLELLVAEDSLAYAVYDPATNTFLALKRFDSREKKVNWSSVLSSEPVLQFSSYAKTNVLFAGYPCQVAPKSFAEKNTDFFRFIQPASELLSLINEPIADADVDQVFVAGIPSSVKKEFAEAFPKANCYPALSKLTDFLLKLHKGKKGKVLYAHLTGSVVDFLLVENEHVAYCNQFAYRSANDFVYYLLACCETLQLNPDNQFVLLCGDITENSEIHRKAIRYIRNIDFLAANTSIRKDSSMAALPGHYLYPIFCAES